MTISAATWIADSMVTQAVFERWPDYRAILIATDHVDVTDLVAIARDLLKEAHAVARDSAASAAHPHVDVWHQAYRDFGVKPRVARASVDALLRRAAGESGLPSISPLVDLYNAVSMINGVPIGGEDLDRYAGPARLVLAAGNEEFTTRANGEPATEHPDAGEPVWVDGRGVTCRRWNWRQTIRTAIADDTTRVGFIIDSLDAPDHTGAQAAASQLVALLPGSIVRQLDRPE